MVQAREGQGASGRRRHAGLGLRDGFFTTGVIDPARAVGLGLTRALTIRRAAQTLGKPARPLMEKGTEAGQRPCGPAKTCTQRLPAPQHRSDQNRKRPPPKKNAQGSWKICPLYTSAMNSSPLSAPTLAAALAGLSLLAPSAAQALTIPVTVGGQIYDVTYTDPAITYTGNESLFNTASNGGKMPWWNTQALAEQFATLVGDSLGLPNTGFGPFFSWEYRDDGQGGTNVETWAFDPAISAPAAESPSASGFNFYATATLRDPSAAVPGPLPLFGAAAAFGMSRRLRQRIRRTS